MASLRPCVAGGQIVCGCLFRPPFLWFISFGGAKEMNSIPKEKGCPFETPSTPFNRDGFFVTEWGVVLK